MGAVLLVTDFVFRRATAIVAAGFVAAVLLTLWFAVPLARYRETERRPRSVVKATAAAASTASARAPWVSAPAAVSKDSWNA